MQLIGSVDERGRPLLRLAIQGAEDELLVIIDTAFTGEMLLSERDARVCGVVILDVEAVLELGDGSTTTVKQGLVTLAWLGRSYDATVHVTGGIVGPIRRARSDGEPVGLLGTALLTNVVLSIDFPQRVVSVKQD